MSRKTVFSALYSGRKAVRVKFSVALSNSFLFFGRDGPRDKTSGYELSSRSLFFCTRAVRVKFSVALSNSFNFGGFAMVRNTFLDAVCP